MLFNINQIFQIPRAQGYRSQGSFHKTWSFFLEATLWCKLQRTSWPRTASSQVWNISPEQDSITSLGNLFHCLTMLTAKSLFLSYTECAVFKSMPIVSSFAHGHYWEESGFLLFIFSHQVFIHIVESPWKLLFSMLKSSSCLSFSYYERQSSPLIISALCAGLTPVSLYLSCISCTDGNYITMFGYGVLTHSIWLY